MLQFAENIQIIFYDNKIVVCENVCTLFGTAEMSFKFKDKPLKIDSDRRYVRDATVK